jgi:hypothetical protein
MAEAGTFVTVTRTATPFVSQTKAAPVDEEEDDEEDLVDTVAIATSAAADAAYDTASRIQEAMECGSIWFAMHFLCQARSKGAPEKLLLRFTYFAAGMPSRLRSTFPAASYSSQMLWLGRASAVEWAAHTTPWS